MRILSSLTLALSITAFASVGACSDKKKAAEEPADEGPVEPECETNSDCDQGEVCLAQECANAASGAIYTDTENAVTPGKVKKHMEMINKQAQDRVDKMMEEAE